MDIGGDDIDTIVFNWCLQLYFNFYIRILKYSILYFLMSDTSLYWIYIVSDTPHCVCASHET